MTITPAGVEFRPLVIPSSVDAADATDFAEMVRVRNEVYREIRGRADNDMPPAEILPHYQPDPHERRHMWVIVRDGAFIGRIGVDIPLEDGSRVAYALIEILRAEWGQGIGSAASALVEETARREGRTVLQSWVEHPAAEGPRLAAPTGFGDIPHDHIARFLLGKGYVLEQVERISSFDLTQSFDTVQRLHDDAVAAAQGYRVVQWHPPVPAEFAAGYAWMKSRMSTDAPSAGLDQDEEAWDLERIAQHDARTIDGGRTMLVTAAQHIASGELCAFNELVIGQDPHGPSHQEDTLVLSEHRGHRLGMLVKTAGLLAWRGIAPHSPLLITYNAEENRPMLDINEAIGFVPLGYEGAWKKVLDD